MLHLPKKIILLDTEYTTWDGAQERNWSGPGEFREIVQIGAIKVDTEGLRELDEFETLVRPIKNPELSEYFTKLTSITQDRVDASGLHLKEALARLVDWAGDLSIYSYGHDGAVLRENCTLVGIPFPMRLMNFFDIRIWFQVHGVNVDQYSSGTIMTAFGKPLPANPHNALADVRGILEGLRAVSELQINQ